MKVVIFAGGLGTRLSEETVSKPKPMVEIGGKPIIWHIMKIYSSYGFNEFVICLGYKGYVIKEYFINYFLHNADLQVDLGTNSYEVLNSNSEKFKVSLIDTGLETKTAGRLKRVMSVIGNEPFMLTYGDGVANIDLRALLEFHKKHGKLATITAVQPEGKFGGMLINDENGVDVFTEKPKGDGNWINAGFFILNPEIINYLPEDADNIMWEESPLGELTNDGQLVAFKHTGFWKCMDALRDKIQLEEKWETGKAEWKLWKD